VSVLTKCLEEPRANSFLRRRRHAVSASSIPLSPMRWVTLSGSIPFISVYNQPPRSTQPGHPSVGRSSEYQPKGGDALRLGIKVGLVRVWVTGETV